ncbi:hypothetical protein ACFWHX_19950 [Streptomyces hirsutus]|uniref:SCO2400 family protein n=1 Tax=Streptomyces hirsutus TaxID=35620 RepID=UPI003664909B
MEVPDPVPASASAPTGRAARRRQLARWRKTQRRALVATAVAFVGGGLTLVSMDRDSGDRARAATAPEVSGMGGTDGPADQYGGPAPSVNPPGTQRSQERPSQPAPGDGAHRQPTGTASAPATASSTRPDGTTTATSPSRTTPSSDGSGTRTGSDSNDTGSVSGSASGAGFGSGTATRPTTPPEDSSGNGGDSGNDGVRGRNGRSGSQPGTSVPSTPAPESPGSSGSGSDSSSGSGSELCLLVICLG